MSAQRTRVKARPKRINPLLPIAALIAVAVVVFLLFFRNNDGPIEGVQDFSGLSRDHVSGATYPTAPPVGGAHSASWLNCGIYRLPVANENAVHSLEHGAVWIAYQPDLPAAEVDRLKGLVRGHRYAILSPYPGIPAPVVAVAWGKRLELQKADDPRLARFIAKYENGPQTPEPGASCSGGTGTPDE